MAISPEEVKEFIADAKKSRENWLPWAERSWQEIKKRGRNNRLFSTSPNSAKKNQKYAAWWQIFKIRQPLLLSRVGIPVCKDATQDGSDTLGASAAFFKERLAINLAKSFPFFDMLSTARDDFLATDFGTLRAYYERDTIKERVKEYLQPQQLPGTEEVVLVDGAGKVIESDDISQDDEGFFVELDKVIDVENERICLEQVLFNEIYLDPDIKRYNRCERMAFVLKFSVPQFKATFGTKAYQSLPKSDEDKNESTPKRQLITVYEYWDKYEREVCWLPENGTDFVKPLTYTQPGDYEDEDQHNGLYDLERFFPVPDPLVANQSTDEFWPITEFYQVCELIEDIHTVFSRMMALTRSIRARLLFDQSIEGLQVAISEASEGDAFGVPNLAQALVDNGGSIDNVLQYIPVEKMVASLAQMYQALEQRLNTLYRLTGVSDLLQGLITDGTQRTFGERQMLEKYALNQHAEPQRKMQEFVRDCYELICEMALKNFKDESLERYMIPQTAPPVHQQNFKAALGLLKNDRKRFRIDLETDSTIALNEQYDKQMRVELVNTLTGAIEKVSGMVRADPTLIQVELHALKYMIQGFRQGKMFQQEVTEAIDQAIQQQKVLAEQPPPPDPTQIQIQLEQARLQTEQTRVQGELKLKEYEILSSERIEQAKMLQEQRMAAIEQSMERYKVDGINLQENADRSLKYEELRNNIAATQAELMLKRDELMVELQRLNDSKEVEMYGATTKERLTMYELQLKEAQQQLEAYRVHLDMQERWATEARLQQADQINQLMSTIELQKKAGEIQRDAILTAEEVRSLRTPAPPKMGKKISVKRDEMGNPSEYQVEGGQGYQVIRDQNGDIVGYEPIGGA
jgi:hypothetical protein